MPEGRSLSNDIRSFDFTIKTLYQYGGPLLIVFGTISSVISLILFFPKTFRGSTCSIYLIARNISNLFFIYFCLLYVTLLLGYDLIPNVSNLRYCHVSIYISFVCDILSPFYLILASIDHVRLTSSHCQIRRHSTRRFACVLVIIGTLFWMLFHTHVLIYSHIVEILPHSFHCQLQEGLYSTLVIYYSLIIKGILIPSLLILFGLWSVKNLRDKRRVTTTVCVPDHLHSRDQQVLIILMKDIIVYILFTLLMSFTLICELITEHHIKHFEQKEVEYLLRHVATFCVSIPFCIGFYSNLVVSTSFRNEVKQLFLHK